MKRSYFIVLFFSLFLFVPTAYSHPGNTDSSGCHTCRTNCSSWGLYSGEYHCHNNKGTSQPLNPIRSTWGDNGTGYTTPAPDYSYIGNNTPSCPSFSSYDYVSKTCKCYSNYIVDEDGSGCISMDKWCSDKYGYNSKYNSLNENCECNYGYVFEKKLFGEEQCVRGDTYCQGLYGHHSSYSALDNSCKCDVGYYFKGDECVKNSSNYYDISDGQTVSSYQCGVNSYLTADNKCSCYSGYVWEDKLDQKNFDCVKKTCSSGYVLKNDKCITHTEDCENSFGDNVYGETNNANGSLCYCKTGFAWNTEKTKCIVERGITGISSSTTTDVFLNEEKNKITKVDNILSNKLRGRILLQVESGGEGWYVNPENNKRYFLGRPVDAFNVMRELGLGISNEDFEKFNGVAPRRLSGKILLKVEDSGKAYYVSPLDLKIYFLGRPSDAFEVMRNLGLGITNTDINKIDIN